jgi:hypothetical protein
MQTKRRIIAGKAEAVEGTPEALTAAETGILVTNAQYTPDIKMLPREVLLATFSKLPDLPGARMASLSFSAEVMGRGVAYAALTLPRLDPYYRACGLVPEIDVTPGAEKVTYKRASANIPSMTQAFLDDDDAGGAVIKKIAGARGNVKHRATTGGQLFADFTFMGVYLDVADGAQLAASYDDVMPPQLLAAQFALAGYAASINSFETDLGNKVAGVPDMNAASGYKAFRITDGDTRGRFDPEAVKVATYDYYGKWKAGLTGALSIGPFGPAQYNKIKITAPKLVTTKVSEGEREGQQINNVEFQLAMNAGDDEFVLEFS